MADRSRRTGKVRLPRTGPLSGTRPWCVLRFWATLLGLLVVCTQNAWAQDTGAASGVVVNSWDGSVLSGATVTVRGTTLAAQTDANGRFELSGLPAGEQVLRISKPGYAAVVVTDVRVIPGQSTTVNGSLRPEFYEMDEYEVTAEDFTQENETILIERQEAGSMVDAIGAEQLSRLGAGDAAEALSKVTGATVADGKYAVIRGLADRYTFTTLNGNDLPSADPDRKAFQLDLLPSKFIQRMDVSKTFSPDMGGGFAGGAINVVTKSYPEKLEFSLEVGGSYNPQANLNEDFLVTDRSSTDWLGKDDGKRALPDSVKAVSPQGVTFNYPNSVKDDFGSYQLSPVPQESPLNSGFALSLGAPFSVLGMKMGAFGGLNYKNEYKFYDDGTIAKYDNGLTARIEKTDTRAIIEYNLSALGALSVQPFENHEVKFNYLYVRSAEDEARRLQGFDSNVNTGNGDFLDESILHWTERTLSYMQLAGAHEVADWNGIKLDWAGSLADTTQDEPDYRIFQFINDPNNGTYFPSGAGGISYPTRFWRDIQEDNTSLRADLTVPLPSYTSEDNAFKTGVALSGSERQFNQRGLSMFITGSNPFPSTGNPNDFLSNPNGYNYRNFPINVTYEGEQEITAGYLMGDWNALEWLNLVGGARYETTDLSLTGFNDTQGVSLAPANLQQNDLLPSVAGTISLRENVLLRAGWSQTVVRPTYREIAAVDIWDVGDTVTYTGNPNLEMSASENLDLRAEWYPRPGEIVAVSGFAKRIQRPIEKIAVNQDQITYINSPTAELLGVEAEFRKNLDFITRMLNEVTLGLNGAYIISEVPLTESQISDRSIRYGETGDSRPLYDQPTFLFNADLTWDHQATGTTITAAGGVVGRRLIAIGLAAPDVYEEPAPQFDVFVTQRLSKNFKIKLFAKNLLDPVYEATQTWPAYGTTPQETTTVVRSYTKGITFGLSATCEF